MGASKSRPCWTSEENEQDHQANSLDILSQTLATIKESLQSTNASIIELHKSAIAANEINNANQNKITNFCHDACLAIADLKSECAEIATETSSNTARLGHINEQLEILERQVQQQAAVLDNNIHTVYELNVANDEKVQALIEITADLKKQVDELSFDILSTDSPS